MKRALGTVAAGLVLVMVLSSWGFFAHKRINRMAVFTLPKSMAGFYKQHIDAITEHAVDPDKRRYTDKKEAPRHFLDADYYGRSPFDSIPRTYSDAIKKYPADTVNEMGTVPWVIQSTYYKLVTAFKERDSSKIIRFSADLGHYVSDAHVPLHMTMNYNGQLSGQVGIHSFWESRLPELFADQYNYFVGRARYIDDPLNEAWKICRATFACVDSTLQFEKELSGTFPADKKYTFITRNNKVVKEYSPAYSKAYHEKLDGMVERQMRSSILETGSFWYSAWVDAGQPNLKNLASNQLTAEEKQKLRDEEKAYKKGQPIGRPETR